MSDQTKLGKRAVVEWARERKKLLLERMKLEMVKSAVRKGKRIMSGVDSNAAKDEAAADASRYAFERFGLSLSASTIKRLMWHVSQSWRCACATSD